MPYTEKLDNTLERYNILVKIIATSGCFDLFHAGHAAFLKTCRSYGDKLLVFLNDDDSVQRLKGRCINPVEHRKAVLEACRYVDEVQVFPEDTPCRLLNLLKPDVFCKDSRYQDGVPLGGTMVDIPEQVVMDSLDGSVIFVKKKVDTSTTDILNTVWYMYHPIVFTDEDIKTGKCHLCGAPAFDQWRLTICALGREEQHILLCSECDIKHNQLTLEFLQNPDVEELIAAYRKTVEAQLNG